MWRYTSAAYDIVYDGYTYTAEPGLYRDEIEDDLESNSSGLIIHCRGSNRFARQYILASPENIVEFSLYRAHGVYYRRYWMGIVKSCLPIDGDEALMTIGSLMDELERTVHFRRWCRLCGAILYSDYCGVDKTGYSLSGAVDSVSGRTVVAEVFDNAADNWLKGGWLVANGRQRKIDSHVGNTITLTSQLPGLVAGMACEVYAGCLHTHAICVSKFDHGNDYKGFAWIPDANPVTQRIWG